MLPLIPLRDLLPLEETGEGELFCLLPPLLAGEGARRADEGTRAMALARVSATERLVGASPEQTPPPGVALLPHAFAVREKREASPLPSEGRGRCTVECTVTVITNALSP
jgi:hypothetical protein